jgi:TolB-like protein
LIYRFEGYCLDVGRQELRRGDQPVDVDPQVLDLLHYLIRNRERVVSKDDLIAHVWHGRIVSDSTLTSRITTVRQAIGDSGGQQRLIRTIVRKGIRFVGEVRDDPGPSAGEKIAGANPDAAGAAPPLPDKPSIAVLPFENMSADPEQQFFADGVAEDIITALSRYPSLFVIARNSSFSYRGRAVDVKQVGRDLGVRYVLEGSLRKSGSHVRVTAQLIEADTGNHVWAERYDRDLADIFAVQDEIAQATTIAIAPAIAEAEQQRAMRKVPASLDAWGAFQRGLWRERRGARAPRSRAARARRSPRRMRSGRAGTGTVSEPRRGARRARRRARLFGAAERRARGAQCVYQARPACADAGEPFESGRAGALFLPRLRGRRRGGGKRDPIVPGFSFALPLARRRPWTTWRDRTRKVGAGQGHSALACRVRISGPQTPAVVSVG